MAKKSPKKSGAKKNKVADLPARSLKARQASSVKGGSAIAGAGIKIGQSYKLGGIKLDPSGLKISWKG